MTSGPYQTIVFDLDGVLYRGREPIDGVAAVVERVQRTHHVLFATNNSTVTEAGIAENIRRRSGLEVDPATIVTSGAATARALAGSVDRALVIGGPGLPVVMEREGVPVTDDWRKADAVVVGLDRDINYDKLVAGSYAVRNGARLVATNHDPTFPTPEGLAPGAGSIVAALETATETMAEVMGKPHPPFAAALRELAIGRVVVVGDRLDSDMALARVNGWGAVLVLTGVTTAAAASQADVDHVLESAAELDRILG